jgi:hypothetical protein
VVPYHPRIFEYTWVLNTWFVGRPEIVDVWGLGGPGGSQKPFQKIGNHVLETPVYVRSRSKTASGAAPRSAGASRHFAAPGDGFTSIFAGDRAKSLLKPN